MGKDHDLEAGKHYPSQMEDPQLRWGFIRKVYSILTLQLLLTVLIASIVVLTPRINQFFRTQTGLIVYLIIAIITMIGKQPANLISFFVFDEEVILHVHNSPMRRLFCLFFLFL